MATVRLLAENPRLKPAELAARIGQTRNYAKKLIQRARRLPGTALENAAVRTGAPTTTTHTERMVRRVFQLPAFESFLRVTKRAEYRPRKKDLEALYLLVCRYAARQGCRLRAADLQRWWRVLLQWRRWASANPERAKRCLRHSRREFLSYAVKAIDAQTPASPFRRFASLLQNYFRAVSGHPLRFCVLLRAFLDLMDGCDSRGIELDDTNRIEKILNRFEAWSRPPRKISVLLAELQAELVKGLRQSLMGPPKARLSPVVS